MALSKTAKIMIVSAAVICLALLVLGLIVINFIFAFEKSAAYSLGIALGCIVTAVKIIMLERAITITVDMGEKFKAGALGSLLFLPRYILTGAILVAAFIFPDIIGRFGVIFALISMQFAAYATNIILRRAQPDNYDNLLDLSGDYDDGEEDANEEDGDESDDDEENGNIL